MNLSVETWISIIFGIVPFGGIVTWLLKRFFGQKSRALAIEHVESKQYFHKKSDKIELNVVYNNKVVCDALVILRIAVKNTGKEDISHQTLIDPIKISFGDKYKILEAYTVKEYNKIRPHITYQSNYIEVSWALLKHQDQIEIEIIAQNNSSENVRELSIDFFNSLSTDINIEGIDDISHGKQETNKDKLIKRYRQYIFFLVGYAVALTIAAFITRTRPDFSYQLLIQSDSTYVDSDLSIFSKENMVEIDSLNEKLSIDKFNKNYVIKGIPLDLPKRNHYSFIFDISLAAFFYLYAVVFYIRYRRKKKKYFDNNK